MTNEIAKGVMVSNYTALRVLFRCIRIILWIAGTLLIAIHTPISYYYGTPLREPSNPKPSDVIILMSHGQINRTWLSLEGTQRTAGALRLYREGFAPYIISSGSHLTQKFDQAGLQAKWLMLADVPSNAIIVDQRSTRTYESVIEIIKILQSRHWNSAVIVTSEMDVPRIRAVFAKQGSSDLDLSFEQVPEARKPSKTTIYYSSGWTVFWHATYEYAGLILYKLRGWI